MARRRPEGNNFHSVKPVKFINNPDGTQGWSQTIRRMVAEKSAHWDERKHGRFKREEVYPCNEGFPGVVRIGPTEGGFPVIFDVILADKTRGQAAVSPTEIDGLHSWLMRDKDGKRERQVSYHEVAGWSSVEVDPKDLVLLERVVLWLVNHWPTRR